MASVINGTNIILYRYNLDTGLSTPFGSATSCSFQSSTDQVEVTSQSSAWYREFKNDIMSWTVSCDGFMRLDTDYSYLSLLGMQQDQIDGETMTVKFSIDNDNGDGSGDLGLSVFTGVANITSISLSGSVEGASTYSVSLQGTGPYVISGTVPTPGGTIITAGGLVYTKGTTAAGGETTITYTDMIGKSCLYVSRGGIDVQAILSSGTPVDEQVKWVSATGVLTFSRALESTEFVRSLFQ